MIDDMLVDFTQEVMRCGQRDNSTDVKGSVYVFTENQTINHSQAKNEAIIYDFWVNANEQVIRQSHIINKTGLAKETISRLLKKPTIQGIQTDRGYVKIAINIDSIGTHQTLFIQQIIVIQCKT